MTIIYTGEMGERIKMIGHDLFFILKPKSPVYLSVNKVLSGGESCAQ